MLVVLEKVGMSDLVFLHDKCSLVCVMCVCNVDALFLLMFV